VWCVRSLARLDTSGSEAADGDSADGQQRHRRHATSKVVEEESRPDPVPLVLDCGDEEEERVKRWHWCGGGEGERAIGRPAYTVSLSGSTWQQQRQ